MRINRNRTDLALLFLRIALGAVFVAHGWQKFFVFGVAGTAGFFETAGIPLAGLSAVVVASVELFGGLALLAGAGTRIASALLAFTMLVATLVVHASNGFFLSNNGYEFALTLLLVSTAVALTGAGRFSVDAALFGSPSVQHPALPSLPRKAA